MSVNWRVVAKFNDDDGAVVGIIFAFVAGFLEQTELNSLRPRHKHESAQKRHRNRR